MVADLVIQVQVGFLEDEGYAAEAQEGGVVVFVGREVEKTLGMGVVVEGEREEVVEVAGELDGDGSVAAEVAVDESDAFLVGALSEHHASGVAWEDVEEEEDEGYDPQKHEVLLTQA